MSLIHLDKSVLTFHFKEILEDGHLGGPLTLVSLSALIFGPKLLSSLASRPSSSTTLVPVKTTSPYRPHISLADWVAHAKKQQELSTTNTEHHSSASASENPPVAERLAA